MKIKKIVENMEKKLPQKVIITTGNSDKDHENQKVVEEINIASFEDFDLIPPVKEIGWDYKLICQPKFIQNSFNKQLNYPELSTLAASLNRTSLSKRGEDIGWESKIAVTVNFQNTVDLGSQQYQDNFLRAVNTVLIISEDSTRKFILLSGNEAENIMRLGLIEKNPSLTLLILHKDKNFITIPVREESFFGENEINCIVQLKLYNGESKYTSLEAARLAKILGYVSKKRFDEVNGLKAAYDILSDKHFINGGFISTEFARVLKTGGNVEGLNPSMNREITTIFEAVLSSSLAKDYTGLPNLPKFAEQMVQLRGTKNEYEHSELSKIMSGQFNL
jgi:hypothetical protein